MRTTDRRDSRPLPRLPGLFLLFALAATTVLAQPKPNFVFILTDDHGWSQLSFAMDPDVGQAASEFLETPNMARLAEQGMRFASGYSPAPLCTPTRRSIFCGMTPARQRGTEFASDFDWEGRLTLPLALKQADSSYRTAHFGKFGSRMGADPEQVGFDESDGVTTNSTGGMPTPMEERGRSVTKQDPKLAFSITERAIDFVERQVSDRRPFYVQLSHYAAHLQVQTRPESLAKFEEKGRPDRAVTHAFSGMLFDLDETVGLMLDALDEAGVAGSTYVILMADNGGRGTIPGAQDSLAAPNRPLNGAKHTLLEGGIRVPFLVTGPGVKPNSISRVPVTGYDLLTHPLRPGGRDQAAAGRSRRRQLPVGSRERRRRDGQARFRGPCVSSPEASTRSGFGDSSRGPQAAGSLSHRDSSTYENAVRPGGGPA